MKELIRAFVKTRTSRHLRAAVGQARLEWYMQRRHRRGIKRAAVFARRRPLRLNLGSGFRPKPGWVNVDLSDTADLPLDLRERLPFDDDSVECIYTEHFFEHLSYPSLADSTAWELESSSNPSEALDFLRECKRVLTRGGKLDIVVPDAEGMLIEYTDRHEHPFPMQAWWGPKWCNTPLHCINYLFRQGREHKYAYDEETLGRVLESVGFAHVARRPFDPATDAENHVIGSLCMTATKPTLVTVSAEVAHGELQHV